MTFIHVDKAALINAYERLGNVHLAAEVIGVSHSVAHRRLTAWGVMRHVNRVTDDERRAIIAYYTDTPPETFNSRAFSASIGRPEIIVSRVARAAGLTRLGRPKSDAHRLQMMERQAQYLERHGHPRGFAGHQHSEAAVAVIGKKSRLNWERHKATGTGLMSPENRQMLSDRMALLQSQRDGSNNYSRVAHGRRPDIGEMYFRSSWEANYARYLMWLQARGEIERWEYEPETFWFEAIKRGVRSYKPDFKVWEKGRIYYVEIKGWMDAKSKTKLRRMKKYHPSVEVQVVNERQYVALARTLSRLIPNWETRATAASVRGKKAA